MSEGLVIKSRLREYEVRFVNHLPGTLAAQAGDSFWIVDQKVMELYRAWLQPLLPASRTLVVEATEFNKTLEYCQILIGELVARDARKNHSLVAIGGGIIQDITAFIASILFRGVNWAFCPTTLLAQADSCVGSKSSLNLGKYKNLLGTFYPPSQIWIEVSFLETLPVEEIKSGIGEILHFYLVDGHEGAHSLIEQYDDLIEHPRRLLPHIRATLEIKKKVVEIDEFDQHVRNLFNYGHTFGHAIETITEYRITHGQAVAVGMDIANYISLERGFLSLAAFESMHQILEKNLLALALGDEQLDSYLAALARDKKNVDDQLTCILTSGPGSMKKVKIPLDHMLREQLSTYFRSLAAVR